jgi:hypothetical protein
MERGPDMSIESVIANKGLIKGFLIPIFYEEHSSKSALGPDDFRKVVEGYACAKCLCEYTMYLVRCPACGHQRDLADDLEAPDDLHVEHLRERRDTEGVDSGKPRTFDDLMADVNANKDIDHVPLSKLMPTKKKRK